MKPIRHVGSDVVYRGPNIEATIPALRRELEAARGLLGGHAL